MSVVPSLLIPLTHVPAMKKVIPTTVNDPGEYGNLVDYANIYGNHGHDVNTVVD